MQCLCKELRDKNTARFKELKPLAGTIDMTRTPAYGKGEFHGTLKTAEEKALTEFDIALIADRGNLCFGGHCTIRGDKFSGAYWTD